MSCHSSRRSLGLADSILDVADTACALRLRPIGLGAYTPSLPSPCYLVSLHAPERGFFLTFIA